MSETMGVPVSLDNDFWQALEEQDYETAEELLKKGIEGTWYQSSGEIIREGDLLEKHLPKYVTVHRATYVEASAEVEEIDFAPDGKSAIVYACYQSDLWLGCRNIGGISDEHEQLGITFNTKECKAFLQVLRYPYERSDE